ncbi:MAG TPA: NrfD/PsrC family molybdoenzyme membrane anchor subunit [Steroidobacteraceae bacterium]|nr:NrfD/PsrC family molybdoenzyme membrane anchor subunit [Steroidobacteraceae bacterium]
MNATAAEVARPAAPEAAPVLLGHHTDGSITDRITGIVLQRGRGAGFWLAIGISGAATVLFVVAIAWLFARGVGIWGINQPVSWGFAITNYVWWVAIGNSGTFISAFLLLLRQRWRTSINRFAEAMTIFAVAMAGLMPILHLGRPWFFYWLAPYPNAMNVWPQWRSPLVWDFFAIATYLIVSILFWYMGLLPDLATMRDAARRRGRQLAYGLAALGWRGDARHWHHYRSAYLLLGGVAAPLVISVHSVVAFEFSFANLPGWHSAIYAPYFIAGALFSGLAMALTITIPLRAIFGLHDFITARHLANIAKLMLACGWIITYTYVIELFTAFYGGDRYEIHTALARMGGDYAWIYWTVVACNVLVPQLIWWRAVRASPLALFAISILVNVGMWLERMMIILTGLYQDFLPSSWGNFTPTFWDWAILAGSLGAFALLFILFIRFVPALSMTELRRLNRDITQAGS